MEAEASTPSTAISTESVFISDVSLQTSIFFLTVDKKTLLCRVCVREREFAGITLKKICFSFLFLPWTALTIFCTFFVVRVVMCSLLSSCVS